MVLDRWQAVSVNMVIIIYILSINNKIKLIYNYGMAENIS